MAITLTRTPKIGFALVLGFVGFMLVMGLGEGMQAQARAHEAQTAANLLPATALALYFLLAQFMLSRGNTHALWHDWFLVLCLNATLIVVGIISLFAEPNRGASYQFIAVTAGAIVCSLAGAAFASWTARRHSHVPHAH